MFRIYSMQEVTYKWNHKIMVLQAIHYIQYINEQKYINSYKSNNVKIISVKKYNNVNNIIPISQTLKSMLTMLY